MHHGAPHCVPIPFLCMTPFLAPSSCRLSVKEGFSEEEVRSEDYFYLCSPQTRPLPLLSPGLGSPPQFSSGFLDAFPMPPPVPLAPHHVDTHLGGGSSHLPQRAVGAQ